MKIYSKHINVTSDHIDFNNHVNNLVYLQWALDISREHWLSLADEKITDHYFWVVRKHEIDYFKQSFEGDNLEINTYVASIRGPFSERIVQIRKESEMIVEVKSNWVFLERSSQKLKRVPEEIQTLFN